MVKDGTSFTSGSVGVTLGVDALSRINRGLWFFTYGLAVSLSDGLVDVSPDVARSYLNDAARSLIEWEQSQRIDVDPT